MTSKMETRIYNLIILDESGSMGSIKSQAIGGFNETIQTIKAAKVKHPEQNHLVTLVTFNSSETKTVYDKADVNSVKELNDKVYCPDSCTPLYDAMGFSLNALKKSVEQDDKVLVTIITDGCENASHEYNALSIKTLVETLKSNGWVFAYIGANQDVEKVAATISITNVMSFKATSAGTQAMFTEESKARTRFFDRVANKESNLTENFFEDDGK
jgi:Mg-chelatase subunit ChlD